MRAARFALALIGAFAGFCLSFLGLLYCVSYWRQLPPKPWHDPWQASARYEPAPDYRAARSIYPYSVVPGGVATTEEAEASIARDPAVAEHYRGIHISQLQPIRLNTTLVVYASFRNATGIHWTKHAIRVPKGELVLSDGVNLIRGRCGNRLTFLPPEPPPTLPALPPANDEPPEIALEYGAPPIIGPPAMPALPLQPATRFWPPPRPPVIWCCSYIVAAGGPLYARPTAGVLEPTPLVLLGIGVALSLLWGAHRNHSDPSRSR